MSDYLVVHCPSCSTSLRVRQQYVGLKVQCKHCSIPFIVRAEETSADPKAAEPPTAGTVATSQPSALDADRGENIKRLEREAARLRADNESLQAEVERLRGEIASARQEAASDRDARERLESDHQAAVRDAHVLRAELARTRGQLDEQHEARQAEVGALQDAVETLRRETRTEIDQRTRDVVAARADVERLQGELDAARRAWEEDRRSADVAAEIRLRAARDEVEARTSEVAALRSRLETIEARAETADAEFADERSRLETERDNLLTQFADERSRLETERDNALADLTSVRVALDEVRANHAELTRVHEHVQTAHAEAETGHRTETELLREDLDRLKQRLVETYGTIEDLGKRAEELQAELDQERTSRAAEARAFTDQLAAVRAEWDDERSTWIRERQDQQEALASSRRSASDYEEIIALLKAQLAEANERPAEASAEDRQSIAARTALEVNLAEKTAEVEELKTALMEAQDSKAQIRSFLAGLGIRLPG